jgi:hypothetical protein
VDGPPADGLPAEGRIRADPAPEERPGTVPVGPAPPEVASRTQRRAVRRTVYGLGVLVAAVPSLILLAAFDHSPLPVADRGRGAVQRPGGHGTATSASPPANSPLYRADRPEGGLTASAERRRDTAGRAPGPRTTTTGPSETPSPEDPAPRATPPITWSVNQHVWRGGCSHAYLVNRGPSAVPPPPAEADAEPWAGSLGAVHAGETGVRISVQGRSGTAVVLQALHVRVVTRRTAPTTYGVYEMSRGCGGSLTPPLFDIDQPLVWLAHPGVSGVAFKVLPSVASTDWPPGAPRRLGCQLGIATRSP